MMPSSDPRSLLNHQRRRFQRILQTLSFRRRLDIVILLSIVAAIIILAIVGATWGAFLNTAGVFDGGLLVPITDERKFMNIEDYVSAADSPTPLLDAVITPDGLLNIAQDGTILHRYSQDLGLWFTETAFSPDDPMGRNFRILRAGCGNRIDTAIPCTDAGTLWAVADDGSLARREANGHWSILVSNTHWLDSDEIAVPTEALTSAAVSENMEWVMLGTAQHGLGLYNTLQRRWVDIRANTTAFENIEVTQIVWSQSTGRFWMTSDDNQLMAFDPNQSSRLQPIVHTLGTLIDLDVDLDGAIWVLGVGDCVDAGSQCIRLAKAERGQTTLTVVLDEQNHYPQAALDRLYYASQSGDKLFLAGEGGVFIYDKIRHGWSRPFSEQIIGVLSLDNGEFYFATRQSIGYARGNGTVTLFDGYPLRENIKTIVQRGEDILIFGVDGNLAQFMPSNNLYRVISERVGTTLNPERIAQSVRLTETQALLISPEGLTVYDAAAMTFLYEALADTVDSWVIAPSTQWVTSGNVLYALVEVSSGTDIYHFNITEILSKGGSGAFFLNLEPTHTVNRSHTVKQAWPWETNQLGILLSDGEIHYFSPDSSVNPIVWGDTRAIDNNFVDIANLNGGVTVAYDNRLQTYTFGNRTWEDATQLGLASGERIAQITALGNRLLIRTAEGRLIESDRTVQIGQVERLNITDAQFTDALFDGGNYLYLAGAGVIHQIDLNERRVTETWRVGGGDVALKGLYQNLPISQADEQVWIGDNPIERSLGDVLTTSVSDGRILTVREHTAGRFIAVHDPTQSQETSCYFLTPSAPDVNKVFDAQRINDTLIVTATDDGLWLYHTTGRTWRPINVGSGANPERIHQIGTWLILESNVPNGNGSLRFIDLSTWGDIDSCKSTSISLSPDTVVAITGYAAVNESAARVAWINADDGVLEEWVNGTSRVVLGATTTAPAMSNLRHIFPPTSTSGAILATTNSELWRYDLSQRTWQEIDLRLSSPASPVTDIVVLNEQVTATLADETTATGSFNGTDSRVTLARLPHVTDMGQLDATKWVDLQDRGEERWTAVQTNAIFYYTPADHRWERIVLGGVDAEWAFERVPFGDSSLGILIDADGKRWKIATELGEYPTRFIEFALTDTDIETALTSEGDVIRLTAKSEVIRCEQTSNTYACTTLYQPFLINPADVIRAVNIGNITLFETPSVLRAYSNETHAEEILSSEIASFSAISQSQRVSDGIILYSSTRSQALIINDSFDVRLVSDVSMWREDNAGLHWLRVAGEWQWVDVADTSVNSPIFRPSSVTRGNIVILQGAEPTAYNSTGRLFRWDMNQKTMSAEALMLPPTINPAMIDSALRMDSSLWWILLNDGTTVAVIQEQCVSDIALYPITTQQANFASTATAVAATEAARPMPTPTPIPVIVTPTETLTPIPTDILTLTPVDTPTPIPTATWTPSLTSIPTATYTPTQIPSATPILCLYPLTQAATSASTPVSARLNGNEIQWIMDDGRFVVVTLNGVSLTVTEGNDATLVPPTSTVDDWGALQGFIQPLIADGQLAYNPVMRLDNNGRLKAVRPNNQNSDLSDVQAAFRIDFQLPNELSVGWLRWDRTSGEFIVQTTSGSQNYSPTDFITNGRLLFEPFEAVLRVGSGQVLIANAAGIWSYPNLGLSASDPVQFAPVALTTPSITPIGFLDSGNSIEWNGGTLIISPAGTRSFTLDDVTLSEDIANRTVSGTVLINAQPQNAFSPRGFIWDERRSVAYNDQTVLLQSSAGIGSATSLTGFDATPNGVAQQSAWLQNLDRAIYLQDGATWLEQNGATQWNIVTPSPLDNRPLLSHPLSDWQLTNGQLQITISGTPYGFGLVPRGLGFSSDQLIAAGLDKSQFVTITDAFTEMRRFTDTFGAHANARSASLDYDRIERYVDASGTSQLYGYDRVGGVFEWDGIAFIPSTINPEITRLLVDTPRLRFRLDKRRFIKEFMLDPTALTSGGWAQYNLVDGRLPFDVVTGVTALNGIWYIGTEMGLFTYPVNSGFELSQTQRAFDLRRTTNDPIAAVTLLGVPLTAPQIIVVEGATGLCLEGTNSGLAACTLPDPFDQFLLFETPLWRWTVDDGVLTGLYKESNGGLIPDRITLQNRQWPHDKIEAAVSCEGRMLTLWSSRWVSLHTRNTPSITDSQSNTHFDTPLSELTCLAATIPFVDTIVNSGTLMRDATNGLWRLGNGVWQAVQNGTERDRLEEVLENPPTLYGNRFRLSQYPSQTGGALYNNSVRGWIPIEWRFNDITETYTLTHHIWTTLTASIGGIWVATPNGVIDVSLNPDVTFDLNASRIIDLPDSDCMVTDMNPSGVLRCNNNSSAVWSGDLTTGQDTGVFATSISASTDPFASATLIPDDGMWSWEMVDRVGGSPGRLVGTFNQEPLVLSVGQFSWDALTALAFVEPKVLDLTSSAAGWYRVANAQTRLDQWDRSPNHSDARSYTEVTTTWDGTATALCLSAQDEVLIIRPGDSETVGSACNEWLGSDDLWRYEGTPSDGVMIRNTRGVGGAALRTLINGAFNDDVILGVPLPYPTSDGMAYALPSAAGVVIFNAGFSQKQLLHVGPFPGIIGEDLPRALIILPDGTPGYIASDGAYTLDERRQRALPLDWGTESLLADDAQYDAFGALRLRLIGTDQTQWAAVESGRVLGMNLLIDISQVDKAIERRSQWGLTSRTALLTLEQETVTLSVPDAPNRYVGHLPVGTKVREIVQMGDTVVLIGTTDIWVIDLNPALLAIFSEPSVVTVPNTTPLAPTVALLTPTPPFTSQQCFGGAADMRLVEAANIQTENAERFGYDFNTTLTLVAGGENALISLTGEGQYDGDFNNLAFEVDVDGELQLQGQTNRFNMQLRLVDNYVYLRVEAPELGQTLGWYRIQIEDVLGTLPFFGGLSEGEMPPIEITDEQREEIPYIFSLFDIDGFTVSSRTTDNVRGVHTYCFDIKLLEFFESASFIEGLKSSIGLVGDLVGIPGFDPAFIQEGIKQIRAYIPTFALVINQEIDQSSQFNVGYRIDLSTDLVDPSLDATATMRSVTVIQLKNHGQPIVVESPTTFEDIATLAEIIPSP